MAKKFRSSKKVDAARDEISRLGVDWRVLATYPHHWRLELSTTYVDFWPTTGTWMARKGGRGKGVESLKEFIKWFN